MSLKSDIEDYDFNQWLEQGGIPVYMETCGKDIGRYKILGLGRFVSFTTEQEATTYYIEKNLIDVDNMRAERERLES